MSRRQFIQHVVEGSLFIGVAKVSMLSGVFVDNDTEILPYDKETPTHEGVIGDIYLQTDIPAHLWVNTAEGWKVIK